MAENKNTTNTPAQPSKAETTAKPAAPVNTSAPVNTTAPVAPAVNNPAATAQTGYATKETARPEPLEVSQAPSTVYDGNMGRKERMALAEKKGILFLSDADKEIYKQDAEAQKAADDAEAEINIKNDDKRKPEDPDKDKFSEDDVIKYMYEKWLIAGTEWLGQKVEKGCGTAYERLRLWTINKYAEASARKKIFESSPTFNAQQDIQKLTTAKSREIANKYHDKIKLTTETSKLLANGEIFAPEHASKLADFATFLQEKHGDKAPEILEKIKMEAEKLKKIESLQAEVSKEKENVSKSKNDAAKKDAERQLRTKSIDLNNAKEKFGAENSQKILVDASKGYTQHHMDAIDFDQTLEQTAVRMAGANVLHNIAQDKDAYKGKGTETAYNENFAASLSTLAQATEQDRSKFLSYDHNQERQVFGTYGVAVDITPENSMGMIKEARKLYDTALSNERSGIISGLAKEYDKEPIKNKSLEKARELVKNSIESKDKTAEEKAPEQVAKEEKKNEDEIKQEELDRKEHEKEDRQTENKKQEKAEIDKEKPLNEAAEPSSALTSHTEELKNSGKSLQDNSSRFQEHIQRGKMLDRPFIVELRNKRMYSSTIEAAKDGNIKLDVAAMQKIKDNKNATKD